VLYTSISPYYDRLFPVKPAVIDFIGRYVTHRTDVLDVGCGTGALAHALSDQCKSITGIDISPDMIQAGRKKYPGTVLLQTDIDGLEDRRFDVIYSTGNTVSYFNRFLLKDLAQKTVNRLTPDGLWIYQTVNWDYLLKKSSYRFPDITLDDLVFQRTYVFHGDEETDFHLDIRFSDGSVFHETHRLFRLPLTVHIDLHSRVGFDLSESFSSWDRTPWTGDRPGATILVFCNRKHKKFLFR
jgi:glycine/sarcosine N-methyltransferase